MWFDEPRIQLTFEKIMEKLTKIHAQLAAGDIQTVTFVKSSVLFRRRTCSRRQDLSLPRTLRLHQLRRVQTLDHATRKYALRCSCRVTAEFLLDRTDKPRIIVIGAGIAGIMAARQLQYFGFETIVLEGRVRRFFSMIDQIRSASIRTEPSRWSHRHVS